MSDWSHSTHYTPELWKSAAIQLRQQYQDQIDLIRERLTDDALAASTLALKLEIARRIESTALVKECEEELRTQEERRRADGWLQLDCHIRIDEIDKILTEEATRKQAYERYFEWSTRFISGMTHSVLGNSL